MIGQMAIAIALLGFNDLGRSVTPTFLFRNRFHLQLSPPGSKMNKKSMWEVSRFLSTEHGILPSCGCKARETMVSKWELILPGTSPVDYIRLIGLLKPYLADNNSLQILNCNILGLAALWPSSLTKPDLVRFRCSSGHILSKTKSVTPHFFYIFDITNSSSFSGKSFRKKSMVENFRANVLKFLLRLHLGNFLATFCISSNFFSF